MVTAPRYELRRLIGALALKHLLESNHVGIEPLDPLADLQGASLVGARVVPKVEREDGESQDAMAPETLAGTSVPGVLAGPSDARGGGWFFGSNSSTRHLLSGLRERIKLPEQSSTGHSYTVPLYRQYAIVEGHLRYADHPNFPFRRPSTAT